MKKQLKTIGFTLMLGITLGFISCGASETPSNISTQSENTEKPVEQPQENIPEKPQVTEENKTKEEDEGYSDYTTFIPAGYEILMKEEGDLNQDNIKDMILVLKKKNETGEDYRPTLLLIKNKSNKYILAGRNDKTVYRSEDGGAFGDPFGGITIKGGYFSMEHMGGSNDRWIRIITYKYNKADANWYLHKDGSESFYATDPDVITSSTILTTKDFGKVSFRDFDINKD